VSHKICGKCGVVYEVKDDAQFCSESCRKKFGESGFDHIKNMPKKKTSFASNGIADI